jgi:hypothetical protein
MHGRLRPLLIVAAAALALLALPSAASASSSRCPGTFQVLHNDRIGPMQLPAGPYVITTRGGLSCSAAANLFADFLQDFDGVLPRPWRILSAPGRSFIRGGGPIGFSVAPSGGGGGGGGGGGQCGGTFQVLHNDRIGAMQLPAGPYVITTRGGLSCLAASNLFAQFLQDFDGILPTPWRIQSAAGRSFIRGNGPVGFSVRPTGGNSGGGGHFPSDGTRCPGTFQVEHNDRIGRLVLPAGPYTITLLPGPGLSCLTAGDLFATFLEYPQGNLPRPWVVTASTGTFQRGRGSQIGFRVKQARSSSG